MSFDLLLKEVADLLINWDRFSCHISQKKLFIAINEKLCISHFPLVCSVKRDMADVNSVSGVLCNLWSLFRLDSKQNTR